MGGGCAGDTKCDRPETRLEGILSGMQTRQAELSAIATRLEETVVKLIGPEPTTGGCGAPDVEPDGLFASLDGLNDRLSGLIERLGFAAERLGTLI